MFANELSAYDMYSERENFLFNDLPEFNTRKPLAGLEQKKVILYNSTSRTLLLLHIGSNPINVGIVRIQRPIKGYYGRTFQYHAGCIQFSHTTGLYQGPNFFGGAV
eukprot:scaffold1060_cov196-Amphora_coffeaeformis.AAC.10